jgi:hypothetical protein
MSRWKASCAAGNYASKKTETEQRIWEIRVGMILKLDRAEKSLPEEQAQDEEGEAAEASSIPSLKPGERLGFHRSGDLL